jgi:hypothetical protein
MREGYTPSEHMEAQDKMERHKESRKEGEFYRQLLDGFYKRVINQASRADDEHINPQFKGEKIDLNTTTHKLKEFKYCSAGEMQTMISEIAKSASQAAGLERVNLNFETQSLAEMTPMQFHQYIEKQKASLIKD